MVADVTGHDIPCAIITSAVAGAFRVGFQDIAESEKFEAKDLENFAHSINKVVLQAGEKSRMMSMVLLVVDFDLNKAFYINCGHTFIYHLTRKKVRAVLVPGSTLGQSEEPLFGCREFPIESGESFILFTDGLFENTGKDGEPIKERDLTRKLEHSMKPAMIKDLITETISDHWADMEVEDDLTCLILRL